VSASRAEVPERTAARIHTSARLSATAQKRSPGVVAIHIPGTWRQRSRVRIIRTSSIATETAPAARGSLASSVVCLRLPSKKPSTESVMKVIAGSRVIGSSTENAGLNKFAGLADTEAESIIFGSRKAAPPGNGSDVVRYLAKAATRFEGKVAGTG